jgi:hypothetical protein
MSSQGMNLQFREPIGQFCSASLARSTAAAEKPGAVLTIASRRSLMTELLRRETGVLGQYRVEMQPRLQAPRRLLRVS